MMTGRPTARPAGRRAMPRWPAGPNWSASRGTTPGSSWKARSGGSGAEGVGVAAMEMQVRERDCPETVGRRDHIVEATLIGTAIARTARAGVPEERPALGVMSLDPQRRQAARIRI